MSVSCTAAPAPPASPALPTPVRASARERFVSLAALRGVVALLLVAFHAPLIYAGAESPIIRRAQLVTTLFFALSGFVMMAAYGHRNFDGAAIAQFVRQRVLRLYPLHLFATVVILLVPLLAHGSRLVLTALFTGGYAGDLPPLAVNWTHVAADLAFLQGFGLFSELHLNFPSWSLGTLFWCSVLFGALALVPRVRLWVFAACLVLSMTTLAAWSSHYMDATYDYGFLRCLAGFSLGVLAHPLYRRISQVTWVWRYAVTLQALSLVLALVYAIATPAGSYGSMAAPFVFTGVLLAFALDRGDFAEMLKGSAWQWLGDRSYSLFMNQAAFLFLTFQAWDWIQYFQFGPLGQMAFGTLAFGVYVAVLLVYSDWTYRNIELRFQAHKKIAEPTQANTLAQPA
jgi:peptidoglycan/LPS O-acetylase OafA/YrhL